MTDTKKKLYLKQIDPAVERIVNWPVIVAYPQDGGGVVECELTAKFAVRTEEQVNALTSQAAITAFWSDPEKPKFGSPLLWDVVKGAVDFREDEGGPSVDDTRAVAILLNNSAVAVALVTAYYAMLNGRARKN